MSDYTWPTTSAPPKKDDNPRQLYLLKTLGLSHDPFAGPVAELELRSSEKEPYFFAYYTDPQSPQLNKPLPQALRQARTAFVFGQPGSGKTTLRYTLEAECRSVPDRTLVVTYELSDKIEQPLTAAEHWARLATELAVDLFIQVIEQLETLAPPTQAQKTQWQAQLALAWPRLRRTAGLILTDDFSDRENGLAALWPRLNRPAVRYISPSSHLINLLKNCWPPETATAPVNLIGLELLQAGIAAAKSWGFKQIFILVDGVDAHERAVDKMLALIAPLLNHLALWQQQEVFFYFFLPQEIQSIFLKEYGDALRRLPVPPLIHTIEWDKDYLTELLHQRLQAAGSRVPGFNALATAELTNQLEDYLLLTAAHSPRHLLHTVSALIDAHAQHRPEQPLLTAADWRAMRQNWSYGPPLPSDITPMADSTPNNFLAPVKLSQ